MRLIDAEKFEVFDATCQITKGIRSGKTAAYFYGEGCRKVLEAIDAAPTIDPESLRPTAHWISVKDRLPEINEPVLVHCWGYISIAWRATGDNGGWYWNSQMSYPEEMVDTDYWMPLPELPGGDPHDKTATN